ncbi:hypothetical protein CEP53_000022 [Fusarium sp. AF-6]|nr:hypothetical protein CEP53_000022 [Fusarium sp. AF-6]
MAYNVLITGANRGIGKDLLKLYLSLPQTTAIAAVRSLSHPSVDEIRDLPVASGTRLIVVKIDSASMEDPKDAATVLQDQYAITKLDTVIANAGIRKGWSLVA